MTERVIATISLPYQTATGISYLKGLKLDVKQWMTNGDVQVWTPHYPQSDWVILRRGDYERSR